MQEAKQDSVCISLIQRELAVLKQKVTKVCNINSLLLKQREKAMKATKEAPNREAFRIALSLPTTRSLLTILWALTGEPDSIRALDDNNPLLCEQIVGLIQDTMTQLLHLPHPLSSEELSALESVWGIVGNLCSIPRGAHALLAADALFIQCNTLLELAPRLSLPSSSYDILLWALANFASLPQGRERLLQLQAWRPLYTLLLRPFIARQLPLSVECLSSILSIFLALTRIDFDHTSNTSLIPSYEHFSKALLDLQTLVYSAIS
ncbi:hypothetical protein WA577_001353 [Blastocystis sp. JDR]